MNSPGRKPWGEKALTPPSAPLSRPCGRGDGGEGGLLFTRGSRRGLCYVAPPLTISPRPSTLCIEVYGKEGAWRKTNCKALSTS
jgi:hypothetical protein